MSETLTTNSPTQNRGEEGKERGRKKDERRTKARQVGNEGMGV
jgi:hypothetical protein